MPHTNQTFSQRWARRLIACYPANWHQRYAEEMLLVLEDAPPTRKTLLNLFLNLFDAYFHQNLVQERTSFMLEHLQSNEMTPSLLQRMRANGLAIYSTTLLFFVTWLVVQGHVADPGRPRVLFRFLSSPFSLLNLLHDISYFLPLFVLFGGLPILLAAIVQAWRGRKVRTLLFCLLGLISPLIAVIGILMLFPYGFLTPFSILIGLLASLVFITFSVERVSPSWHITRYALALATCIPVVMLLSLVALLLLVVPSLVTLGLSGDISYVLREDLLLLIMGGMLIFSLLSLKKGFQAKRAMQTLLK
jgi:hypothetical protein